MQNIRMISLYLLVLMATAYAGLGFFFIMCPFEQHFTDIEFIKYWQTVDGYMGKRMPVFGMTWLALYAVNIIVFARTWSISYIFWIIIFGLVAVIADIVFTDIHQLPLNEYIQTLDLKSIREDQLAKLHDLRIQTNENFALRKITQYVPFFLLCITPYLLPGLEKKLAEAK